MKTITVKLKSESTYSQSRYLSIEKLPKESAEDYDKRVWRDKAHSDAEDNVYIPPMAFKRALDEAAKRNGKQIAGKGKATYTKHFVAGVLCTDPVYVGMTKKDLVCRAQPVDAQGKKGSAGGTMVVRRFPDIPSWEAEVTFYIVNDIITEEVFEEFLREAGLLVGIGTFRPENGGYYGRFSVESINWPN